MKLRCLIVDDEPPAIKVIESYLLKLESVEIIATANNSLEALSCLQKYKIDLVFLDINMPEISGIGLLKIIKDPPIIILTTAYSDYALESYDYNVTDYLLKPIRFERFIISVEKALAIKMKQKHEQDHLKNNDYFEFKSDGQIKRIKFNEIRYLQSLGNYIKIFVGQGWHVSLQTTREAENVLPKEKFVRIHKSYIVNSQKVTNFDGEFVYIEDIKLPLGKTYKKYFMEQKHKTGSI